MPDYKQAKIYKMCGGDKTYIGHTTQTLGRRFSKHKNEKMKSCLEILSSPDCRIELVEEYPCNSFEEITEREQYWIELYKSTNLQRSKATEEQKREKYEQWIKSNPEKIKGYFDKYRKKNQDKITEKAKVWKEKVGWNETVNQRGKLKRFYLGWLRDFNV
jgi:Fe-S-cluster containining protein